MSDISIDDAVMIDDDGVELLLDPNIKLSIQEFVIYGRRFGDTKNRFGKSKFCG